MSLTGKTKMEILNSYDSFVSANYNKLYTHALCVTKNEDEAQDILHDVYIKIKNFIIASGYTTTRFITFFCKSITNQYIDIKRKRTYQYVDETALVNNEYEDNYMEYEIDIREKELTCKAIFQFIESRYNEKECYVFKVYFLYPSNQRMTYAKISEQTGMSINYCSETIKKIRMDIRNNFKPKYNYGTK